MQRGPSPGLGDRSLGELTTALPPGFLCIWVCFCLHPPRPPKNSMPEPPETPPGDRGRFHSLEGSRGSSWPLEPGLMHAALTLLSAPAGPQYPTWSLPGCGHPVAGRDHRAWLGVRASQIAVSSALPSLFTDYRRDRCTSESRAGPCQGHLKHQGPSRVRAVQCCLLVFLGPQHFAFVGLFLH